MTVEILEVKGKKDLGRFINVPFIIYKDSKYWVPPLVSEDFETLGPENPALEYCEARLFIALKEDRPVGRIVGIINHKYIDKWENKYARFGWVEFIDDREVSSALFTAVEKWAREKGMSAVHGPLGFTDMDPEGILIWGFDEMGTLPMIYNHPYYPEHLETMGYEKDIDWYEFEIEVPESIPPKVQKVKDIVLSKLNVHLLNAKKASQFKPYIRGVFDILNKGYANLYGTVELTEKQIEFYTKQYFGFIDPKYTKIMLDEHNRVVAFGIAMPSLSKALQRSKGRLFPFGFIHFLYALKRPKMLDLYLVAVDPEYLNMGLNAVLIAEVTESAIKNGIKTAETSGELESNSKVQSFWKHFNRRHHKTRRCFIKKL